MALIVSLAAFTYFSDYASSMGSTPGPGTISLGKPLARNNWSAGFNNMKPGDTVTLSLNVKNTGSSPLRYWITTRMAGDLAIRQGADTNVCTVSAVKVNGVAYPVYPVGSDGVAYLPVAQLLNAGVTDSVGVAVTMPEAAGNGFQGKSGTLDVSIYATQATC